MDELAFATAGGLAARIRDKQLTSREHLSAAGLDVFRQEPVPAKNSLLSLDNVMVTPHTAWLTNETLARCMEVAVRNSLAIMRGNEPEHRVA